MKQYPSGRPTKEQKAAILIRNRHILSMHRRGYPLDYIAIMVGLHKGQVSKIINNHAKGRKEKTLKVNK